MKIIDTHCHLDCEPLYERVDGVISDAKKAGVSRIIIPGADISTLPRAMDIASRYDDVYYAVGVHPYDIDGYDESVLLGYLGGADNGANSAVNAPTNEILSKCVAIGECGLDYHYDIDDDIKSRQKEVFISQINLAVRLQKPLIIHTRDANEDTYKILDLKRDLLKDKAVFHCFNACEMLLDFDFYFGIGGVLTFKNAKKLVQILPKIPLDKIILETDAPYLTPHPYRGQTNEPKYLPLIASKIGQILDLDYETVLNITQENALRLFFGGANGGKNTSAQDAIGGEN